MTKTMDEDILRYLRQVVLKTMDRVRSRMRGSDRLLLKIVVESSFVKDSANPTKGIDREAEDLIIQSLLRKLPKMNGVERLAVFSEECGIFTHPKDLEPAVADWVVFIDPIDGTEFAESLQGGWCLLALYNRRSNQVEAAVAGDIFLNRLYWASRNGPAEALDFVTHSWFKLDGGPQPKKDLTGARVNFLMTKVDRFKAVASQDKLLDAIAAAGGRINLAWGSNMIIQVAAGYADAAVEFHKGFATYDILPGLFIAEQAGLTLLDLEGKELTSAVDIDEIFAAWKRDSRKPFRTKFVVAKEASLARQILGLLHTRETQP
jgi:myo-inositol-1(or 4)-monophosphatase